MALPHVADDDDAVTKQCTAAPVVPNPCHGESRRDVAGASSLQTTIDGSDAISSAEEIKDSPCQRLGDDDDSQDGQTSGHSIVPRLPEKASGNTAREKLLCELLSLPGHFSFSCQFITYAIHCPFCKEDVWRHIHSLMPMDDAARAACLSHTFLNSWRCYPKLILSSQTVKKHNGSLRRRIESILKNHSGIGVKILRLHLHKEYTCFDHIDRWLMVVTPGIEELTLVTQFIYKKYTFPCSVLSAGVRNSILYLHLESCVFHATADLGPFRRLTSLILHSVSITGDELECLLSNSLALERLDLKGCREIVSLKIPPMLQRLSYLKVAGCYALRTIENKAPSISNFSLFGILVKLLLGEASQTIKLFNLFVATAAGYARANLPSIMPNLELLNLSSSHEENTPMLPTKFVNLKHLYIQITSSTLSPSYDYSSLVSFLDASPSLETWRLEVPLADMGHELVGSSPLRQLQEQHHEHLKIVTIVGFHDTKSLVELTCCIVKSAVSLESLTLDTTCCGGRSPCCPDGLGVPHSKFVLEQASRAVAAIRRYIEDEVAPTTKLTVIEHCPQCIADAVDDGMDCIAYDLA